MGLYGGIGTKPLIECASKRLKSISVSAKISSFSMRHRRNFLPGAAYDLLTLRRERDCAVRGRGSLEPRNLEWHGKAQGSSRKKRGPVQGSASAFLHHLRRLQRAGSYTPWPSLFLPLKKKRAVPRDRPFFFKTKAFIESARLFLIPAGSRPCRGCN